MLFFFSLFCLGEFQCPVFQITAFFSASSGLLLNPSSIFFSSVTILFVSPVWYILIFSLSLLKFSLFIHSSPKFGDHSNIFITIDLNSLSGKLLLFVSRRLFSGVLSCSFVWNIFLCFLILLDSLCLLLHDKWNSSLSCLEGVTPCRGWTLLFNLVLVSGCLSNYLAYCFRSVGPRNTTPPWSPEPRVQGASLGWAAHTC